MNCSSNQRSHTEVAKPMIQRDQCSRIHPSAIIDPSAQIGSNVSIGPWCVIGANVMIGDGSCLDPHVVVEQNTVMGCGNRVHSFAAIGGDPQDSQYRGEKTTLEIGDHNIIREFVTIHRGSTRGAGVTRVGDHNFLMAYTHIAHDCVIGNRVLFVNNATIAGHVQVDDYAILGAFTAIHQYCRVGAYSFLSRGAEITKDILPYMLITDSDRPRGLNSVGLRRHGFSEETITRLKRAYHLICRSRLKLQEIRHQLLDMLETTPEIQRMIEIIDQSTRGVAR